MLVFLPQQKIKPFFAYKTNFCMDKNVFRRRIDAHKLGFSSTFPKWSLHTFMAFERGWSYGSFELSHLQFDPMWVSFSSLNSIRAFKKKKE